MAGQRISSDAEIQALHRLVLNQQLFDRQGAVKTLAGFIRPH